MVARRLRGQTVVDNLSLAGTEITATGTELNIMDGVTATTAELNIMDGVTSTTAELNILDGVTSTTAELNILDGVTSTTAELNILDGVTATYTEINTACDGITATAAEINTACDGVTATAAEINTQCDLSATGALVKCVKYAIAAAPDGSEQDTGVDLPTGGIVLDCFVNVTTAEATGATKTLDVGLLAGESGGDTNGFLAAIDVSSTGLKRGVATITAGGSETYFASSTRGALFASLTAGSDSAGDVGTYYEFPHILNGTAVSLCYDAGSNDWVEFRGTIYVIYCELA